MINFNVGTRSDLFPWVIMGTGQDQHVDVHLMFFKLLRQAVTDCTVINRCPHTLEKVFN